MNNNTMKKCDPLSMPRYMYGNSRKRKTRNGKLYLSIKRSELKITQYFNTTNWKLFVATL